jgi:hypothetical protein
MTKIAAVESSGGWCGVNPFSDPNNPSGTAICDRLPPARNPSTTPAPPPLESDPNPPVSSSDGGPEVLLGECRDVIKIAARGYSPQLAQRLQQDMNACSDYANQGELSPRCCTDLGQAANFSMVGTVPARQQAKLFQESAANAWGINGLAAAGPPPRKFARNPAAA